MHLQSAFSSLSRVGFSLGLVAAITLGAEPASAQSAKAFGAGAPFDITDLPPSQVRTMLETLSGPARESALNWLHGFSFTEGDLEHLRLDPQGGVHYADSFLPEGVGEADPATGDPAFEGITQAEAFTLHSRPGSQNVVYVDFNGHVIQGTAWNASFGQSSWRAKPYDPDGNPSQFSDAELANIAAIWHRIAEDFAQFDIDVTTEEPASFTSKTGRILVTHDIDENCVARDLARRLHGVD